MWNEKEKNAINLWLLRLHISSEYTDKTKPLISNCLPFLSTSQYNNWYVLRIVDCVTSYLLLFKAGSTTLYYRKHTQMYNIEIRMTVGYATIQMWHKWEDNGTGFARIMMIIEAFDTFPSLKKYQNPTFFCTK